MGLYIGYKCKCQQNLVLFPDSFVDIGKLPLTLDSLIARELLQVKRISGIRHISNGNGTSTTVALLWTLRSPSAPRISRTTVATWAW